MAKITWIITKLDAETKPLFKKWGEGGRLTKTEWEQLKTKGVVTKTPKFIH